MRIELTSSAWKAEVLPLYHIRIMWVRQCRTHFFLERKTRFELATLALARRCSTPEPLPHIIWWRRLDSNQCRLSQRIYSPPPLATRALLHILWSWQRDLNPRPADYKSAALPTELCQHTPLNPAGNGGRNRARTYDPLLVRQVLSQLSYAPSLFVFVCSAHLQTIKQNLIHVKCFFCIH